MAFGTRLTLTLWLRRTADAILHTRSTYMAVSWMNVATKTVFAGANSCRFLKMFGPEIFHIANRAKSSQLDGDQWLFKCWTARKDKMVVNVIGCCWSCFSNGKTSVLKAAKITENVCTPAQSDLLREDWQLSVRVWPIFKDVSFTWDSCYICRLPISVRCWGWFSHIRNYSADSPELIWNGGWDFDYKLTLFLNPGLMGGSGTYWQGEKYPNMKKCTTLLITLFCILGKEGHLSHWLWIVPIILLRRIIISGVMSVVLEEMLHVLSSMPQFCSVMLGVYTLGKCFSPNWSESEYYSIILYYILYDRLHPAGWIQ